MKSSEKVLKGIFVAEKEESEIYTGMAILYIER